MPDFVVSTAFKATDKISPAFAKMTKRADMFGKRATKAFRGAGRSAGIFGGVVKGILATAALRRGLGALQQGVRGVVDEFLAFDLAITAAAAKFGDIKRGSREFEALRKTARDVGATTEFTAAKAAEGLRFQAKAGFSAAFAMKSLKSFVDLATASEMDFSRAADIATDVMGSFGLNVEDTEQRLKNLNRVNDVLSKTVNIANIDLEDLFATIQQAGPVAKLAGISIEKFSAIAAFIGGAGIKGTRGATALKNAILNLVAPSNKAKKILKKLGVDAVDPLTKALKDPLVLFKELRVAMKDMGGAAKAQAMDVIFGRRAIAGMSVSIEDGEKALSKFEKQLMNARGESKRMADFIRTAFTNRLEALKSASIELGFKFIDAFEDKIPGAIDTAIQAVRKFDVKGAIDGISRFADKVENLMTLASDLKPIIWGVVGAFVAYEGVLKGIVALEFAKKIWAVIGPVKTLTGLQWGLNAALVANPIGAFVLAVGLLTTAIVMVIQEWDSFRTAGVLAISAVKRVVGRLWNGPGGFKELWEGIQEGIVTVIGWFDKMLDNPFFTTVALLTAPWLAVPALIIKHWEPVVEFFKGIGDLIGKIGDKFSRAGKTIGEGLGLTAPDFSRTVGAADNDNGAGAAPVTAPNQTELEARQSIDFRGLLQLQGFPQGTTVDTTTQGAPPIETEMLGENI